jgi:hypothetical protein
MKYLVLAWLVAPIAATSAMADVPGQPTAKQDPNRIVCKTESKVGTRFPTRICRTRAEWDQIAEEHRRAGAEMVAGALPRGCDKPENPC